MEGLKGCREIWNELITEKSCLTEKYWRDWVICASFGPYEHSKQYAERAEEVM